MTIAVDCKCYGRMADVKTVEAFLGLLDDVRVSKGILVTTKGYSKAAKRRAETDSRDIQLETKQFEYLSEYHSLGGAFAWSDPLAVLVRLPDTWVIDNTPPDPAAFTLFSAYPLGYTRESAMAHGAFIYGNIVVKETGAETLEAVCEQHNEDIRRRARDARIQYLEPVQRRERTILRKAFVHSGYLGHEYTLYIDHPKGIVILVLLCPSGEDERHLPVLTRLGETCILLEQATSSHSPDASILRVEGQRFGGVIRRIRLHRPGHENDVEIVYQHVPPDRSLAMLVRCR